jgi:16S rRNA (guanine966-N2)-methyltransferase
MRIVGGRFKGRTLAAPKTLATRPTSDRLRETIFNVLAHGHDDACREARVLDLFAGTGALGLEALSRGAAFAVLVDDSAEARGAMRTNIDTLGVGGHTRILRRDATKLGPVGAFQPFSLVFLDPPYRRGLVEQALGAAVEGGWFAPGALVLAEEAADTAIAWPDGFDILDQRDGGEGRMTFARFARAKSDQAALVGSL